MFFFLHRKNRKGITQEIEGIKAAVKLKTLTNLHSLQQIVIIIVAVSLQCTYGSGVEVAAEYLSSHLIRVKSLN